MAHFWHSSFILPPPLLEKGGRLGLQETDFLSWAQELRENVHLDCPLPEDPLEKEMATHSSSLVWKIPWTEEPGRLWSKGSQRVGHD